MPVPEESEEKRNEATAIHPLSFTKKRDAVAGVKSTTDADGHFDDNPASSTPAADRLAPEKQNGTMNCPGCWRLSGSELERNLLMSNIAVKPASAADATAHFRPAKNTDALNAVVLQRISLSDDLIVLRVVPDDWDVPEFSPGQFAVLGLPATSPRCEGADPEDDAPPVGKLIKRAYSIASSSVMREYLEFYIVLVSSGALTPRLFALKPGARLWLGPKIAGLFTLDHVPDNRHLVLISTGTGLAPYVSMVRSRLACGGPRRIAVIHGARHSSELGYRSELEALDHMCNNFTYLPVISRPDEETLPWRHASGYVQSLWTDESLPEKLDFTPDPQTTHVFLCGNPGMIGDMLALLQSQGFQEHSRKEPGQIHVEKYW